MPNTGMQLKTNASSSLELLKLNQAFVSADDQSLDLENEINDWLKKHPNIKIIDILQFAAFCYK
jgi:hypothetical protein